MKNHSPSPWEFLEAHSHNDEWSASRPLTICCADNEDVANVFSHNDSTVSITRETAIANARLIAAAPDLLSACKLIVDWHGSRGNDENLLPADHQENEIKAAMLAIAKAEGRS